MTSDAWIAPLPSCPVHGQMHYDADRNLYMCCGWDGEPCPEPGVRPEDLNYTHLGHLDAREDTREPPLNLSMPARSNSVCG